MIRLVKSENPEVSYTLLVDKVYTVGRKTGEITCPEDHSVSRYHARITAEHPIGNLSIPILTPSIVLTDLGSKFGTFANQEGMVENSSIGRGDPVVVSVGDTIRFGMHDSIYKITYTPMVLLFSNIKASAEVKGRVSRLGGHVVNTWSSHVTHVVMEGVSMTMKLVCGLLGGKPIVTPDYVKALHVAYEEGHPLPDVSDFVPLVAEQSLQSFDRALLLPNPSRNTLFVGKTFLFRTEAQMSMLGKAIFAGGGESKLLEHVQVKDVGRVEFIIICSDMDDWTMGRDAQRNKLVLDVLQKESKRLIPPAEVGMAGLFCSIQRFCNPKYKMSRHNAGTSDRTNQNGNSEKDRAAEPTPGPSRRLAQVGSARGHEGSRGRRGRQEGQASGRKTSSRQTESGSERKKRRQ